MGKITDVFFNWEVLLISFCTFAVLSLVKRIGTKRHPGDKKKVIGGFAHHPVFKSTLPLMPYLISLGLIFIPGVPLPAILVGNKATIAVKVMYGIYAAWLSDKVFQVVKGILEKAGVKFPQKES